MTPLTGQEQAVKELLVETHLAFEPHYIFEISPRLRMSIDFLIFLGAGVVLECTYCEKRKGSALLEMRRRGAHIDYRFHMLKLAHPKLRYGALLEAPNEDYDEVMEVLRTFPNMDFAAASLDNLATVFGV